MLHPNPHPLRAARTSTHRAAHRDGRSRVVAVRRRGDRWVRLVRPARFTAETARDLGAAGYAVAVVRRGPSSVRLPLG